MSTITAEPLTPAPATAPPALAADLLLVRLLTAGQRPRLNELRKPLDRFFRRPPTRDQWAAAVDRLRADSLIEPNALCLTEAGRARALAFLGISELPPKSSWQTIRSRFLLPKALGLEATADSRKRLGRADQLAALLLKQQFRVTAGNSLNQVLTALACREVGLAEASDWSGARRALLSRMLGSQEPLANKDITRQFPRVKLNTSRGGMEGLRDAAFVAWTEGATEARRPESAPTRASSPVPEPETADFDLPAFAHTVRTAARHCPSGRFGDNKVFINHLWRSLQSEPGLPRLGLPEFKQKLVEANAAGLLTLSRADLVQEMDPADVAESETPYLNGVFHFVLTEGAHS
jgi:hypothetical protein